MDSETPKLTYLVRQRDRRIHPPVPAPPIHEVREPLPRFGRLRKFFRPWRLIGKLTIFGLPFWATSAVLAAGGWAAGALSGVFSSLGSVADAGLSAAGTVALLPFGLFALWAGILALLDFSKFPQQRKAELAYQRAAERLGEPDVLTPDDMKRMSVREALTMLAHMRHMLDELSSDKRPFSGVLLDSLRESHGLMERSVLELVSTERKLAEWTGRLGEDAGYTLQLQQRRQALLQSYPEIIDRCLKATDQALAKQARVEGEVGSAVGGASTTGGAADLEHAVAELLERCQRAIDKVDAADYDEQEFLLYAAKEAEGKADPGTTPAGTDTDKQRES
ncbi:hypothetical protein OT109_08510 [Phycisphaeraceae bacterium D3-23]